MLHIRSVLSQDRPNIPWELRRRVRQGVKPQEHLASSHDYTTFSFCFYFSACIFRLDWRLLASFVECWCPNEPSCFSLMSHTLRWVTQDVSTPLQFLLPRPVRGGGRCAKEGYQLQIATVAPDSIRDEEERRGEGGVLWVHHCRRGKPHRSNKLKHLPAWLRWQWGRGRRRHRVRE